MSSYQFYVLFIVCQVIVYEGQDKNPEMCRVLLTHEIMCRYLYAFKMLYAYSPDIMI